MVVLDAYLFGSYVKGTFNEDSDIDIAIVSEQFTGDIIEDTFRLMRFRRDIDLRIEPHPFTPNDFVDDNPLVSEIKKYGIKII
ncbi:nucleotidyltransferase domain-containing protein [Caldicellulosiruptoraceae bacterium PP1]